MFVWFAKKFETSIGDDLTLSDTGTETLARLYARNLLSVLTFLSVVSVTFSIAISQTFLGAAVACWLYLAIRYRQWSRPAAPAYFLAAFAATAVLSAAFSPHPMDSLVYFKKFWIFLLLWILPVAFRRSRDIERAYCWISVGATLSAGVAIFQYFFDPRISLVRRVTGLTGHWMTFAGLQMLSLLAVSALLLSLGASAHRWIYPAIPIQVFALALSQTRSAWLGLLAGLLTLVCLINKRWIVAVAATTTAGYLLLPEAFRDRLHTSVDPSDPTTRARLELLRTGWNMIKAHPWFGVGPKMVPLEYPRYNTTNEFPAWIYQHLHNNFVQIGAELGLPALLAWICLLAAFAAHSVRHLVGNRLPEQRLFAARAALSCIVALVVAGLFEYNFGDSEVLTLFLFVVGAPFVLFREADRAV